MVLATRAAASKVALTMLSTMACLLSSREAMAKERPSRRSAPQGVSSAATLRARLSTYCICFLLLSRFMKITTTAGLASAG